MENVLITGGTGLIGRHLTQELLKKGYTVSILSRTETQIEGVKVYTWNLDKNQIEEEAITKANFIIHLAGASIAKNKWTKSRKQLLKDSRVKSTQLLFSKIKELDTNLKAFISASAIGYYGMITSETIYSETHLPSNDFLGTICKYWEISVDKFKELAIRTVKIRTGIVLTKKGGALSKMSIPVKFGAATAIGSGRQYIPWIQIEDLCNIYIKAIEDKNMNGAYNAVAPDFQTNKEFTKILAKTMNKPFWTIKIPSFILKLVLGEMSNLLLKGSRISAKKIRNSGFEFKFPHLENALNDVINNN